MSAIAELEAQLRAAWDTEAAAVYADALQAAGDARGELIALDLQLARGATPALREARRAAVQRWLGATDHWPSFSVERGLLDVTLLADAHSTIDEHVDALFGSPGGRFVRKATIFGDARSVQRALDRMTREALPWLEHLVIDQTGRGSPQVIAGLAAPHLRTLEVRGERVIAPALPPSVTRLALQGRNALAQGDAPLAGVIELDLAFDVPDEVALRSLAPLAGPRVFPSLARLDLTRNAASYPGEHPRNVDPLGFVTALDGRDRLRTLRLPALRRVEQRAAIRALLDAHPAMHIEVTRSYRAFADVTHRLTHRRLHLAPTRPWPPPEQLSVRDALIVALPDRQQQLVLVRCVEALEAAFDDMSPPARAGWLALWDALDGLPYEDAGRPTTRAFPAALLATALAEVRDVRCADTAAMLRGTGEVVTLSRHWTGSAGRHRGELALERARLALPDRDHVARRRVGEDLVDAESDLF